MDFIAWLKELFKGKKKTPPSDAPHPDTGYPQDNKPAEPDTQVYKKIAIIVGHTKDAQGAVTYKVNGAHIPEYTWNKQRAEEIKELMNTQFPKKEVKIFYRDGIGRSGVASFVGKWKADVSLELHFNSIGLDKDAFGSEMLVLDGDDISAEIGNQFLEELTKQFKTKLRGRYTTKLKKDLRGIKALKKVDRGYENIALIKKEGVSVVLLIEPFFAGTKTDESKQFIEDPKKYSRVLGNLLGQLP